MELSKCCKKRLISIYNNNNNHGIDGPEAIYPTVHYCSKCGLMYYKIKHFDKPEEPDEWE